MEIDYKLYKDISETLVPNVSSIRRAMDIVYNFIKKKGLILYGGMSIDLTLKHFQRGGIYDDNLLPDYDFYSANNQQDAIELAQEMIKAGYIRTAVINARHLSTRRLKINEHDIVADISYYPEPYYSQLPTIDVNGCRVLHPDFQKIDFYRSIAYLYEGFPGQEYYTKRLYKDIVKLNKLESLPEVPIKMKKNLEFDCITTRANQATKFKLSDIPENSVISGILALAIICDSLEHPFSIKMSASMDLPCLPEFFTDEPKKYIPLTKIREDTEFYMKTKDIMPAAVITNNIIYYDNKDSFITCAPTKYGKVVNIYYLAGLFLFKHYMLPQSGYSEYYKICRYLISHTKLSDDALIIAETDKYEPEVFREFEPYYAPEQPLISPLTINGTHYGVSNKHASWYFHELKERMSIMGKEVKYRPKNVYCSQDKPCTVPKTVNLPITYNINGARTDKFPEKPAMPEPK